jgi:tellurite methyltransferase
MNRIPVSFIEDHAGGLTAVLDCGHRQNVREREISVDCPQCDRFEWPVDFIAYKRTPEFTETTIPAGLLKDHATKKGVWARIVVLEGCLMYTVEMLNATFRLDPATPGIVLPEVLHHIAPLGAVRFYVEFNRAQSLPRDTSLNGELPIG